MADIAVTSGVGIVASLGHPGLTDLQFEVSDLRFTVSDLQFEVSDLARIKNSRAVQPGLIKKLVGNADRIKVAIHASVNCRSEPASDPVWLIVISAPSDERPVFNATMGIFFCSARMAAAEKPAMSCIPSMCNAMAVTRESSSNISM